MSASKEARHYQTLPNGKLECLLCPVGCKLKEGQSGICFGRTVRDGKLWADNYGQTVSLALDPIEKKPLYHFYPGSQILSVGPNGCNLRCDNCQNWQISQIEQPTRYIPPEELVSAAKRANSIGIAYTYSEPLIWWEYILDTAQLARQAGLKTVLVSNGYINEAPWRELVTLVDAMNIDIKSMQPEFYRKVCKSSLPEVLRTAEIAAEAGVALELTNLVITGLNDSEDDFDKLADWIAGVDRKIPLHFSRYFPHHKMDHPATPTRTLKVAHLTAIEKLDYVYLGNVNLDGVCDTYCPGCGALLVRRSGYQTEVCGIASDKCAKCRRTVDMVL
ncbi:MAG: AmmeMemoRadiSam system radical SAM enzyme [bacterium]